ncbi:hypothetical protein PFISCL1PPCAC_19696, partial [Pristionchus fissidentatus]
VIIDSPNSIPMIHAIPQPPSAKSVKIIKMCDIVFKGVIFIGWNKRAHTDERQWFAWNDYTGIPKFEFRSARSVVKKRSDWDPRLSFAMFTSRLLPTNQWVISEMFYSDLDIARREEQIPCSLFVIDDLTYEEARGDEGFFVSKNCTRIDGSPLRVSVASENCEFNIRDVKEDYAAIVCPIYSNDGVRVSFRALALFAREEWLTDEYKKELKKVFYTWNAGRHWIEKTAESIHPVTQRPNHRL